VRLDLVSKNIQEPLTIRRVALFCTNILCFGSPGSARLWRF